MRLHYNRLNDLSKLHDELITAGIVPERVEGLGNDVWLTVPNNADEAAIAAAVAAHDPTPRAEVDPDAELTAAITAATTLTALKAALLGSRGGRVKARPGA